MTRPEGSQTALVGGDQTWWSEARLKCLELTLAGRNKADIARELRKSRNTIIAWSQHPEFVKKIQDLSTELMRTTRTRRQVATIRMTDKLERATDDLLEKFEKDPDDTLNREAAFDSLEQYRRQREREDADSGFNVQVHAHTVQVEGGVQHSHAVGIAAVGFKEFLQDAVRRGVIDVEAVEREPNPQKMLLEATRQALLSSDLLDEMAAREQAAMAAEEAEEE